MPRLPQAAVSLPPITFFRMRRYAPQWIPEADWQKGMIRDAPRIAIPPGGFYDATDFMFNNPGLAYKRGGTSYAGPAMGTANYAKSVAYVDSYSTPQLVAVGDDNHLYKITAGTTTDLGLFGDYAGNEKLKVWTVYSGGITKQWLVGCNDSSTTIYRYDGGGTVDNFGSVVRSRFSAIYKGRLVVSEGGASVGHLNRLYFSTIPSLATFNDIADAWIDTSYQVTGLAALQNMLLIFSNNAIERLTGSVPPPGSDMDLGPVTDIGSPWAKSLSVWNNQVLFANHKGVYLTNGVGVKDLTTEGGISSYWQGLFNTNGQTVATGVYGHRYLFATVLNTDRSLQDTLVCDLARTAWWRLTNIAANCYARYSGTAGSNDELYFANAANARVVSLSGCFNPSASNKNDHNGAAVAPMLETRPLAAGVDLRSYGLGRVTYDMRDAATDNPTLAVQVAAGVEAPSYGAVAESPLAETTNAIKRNVTISKVAQAVSVKLTQTHASAKTELYGIETEVLPLNTESSGPFS